MNKEDMKNFEYVLNIVKKFGIGLVLFVFFLLQYIYLNNERREVQEAFKTLSKENVAVLIKISEKLDSIDKELDRMNGEIKEIRYEQRVNNNIMGKEPKRYLNE